MWTTLAAVALTVTLGLGTRRVLHDARRRRGRQRLGDVALLRSSLRVPVQVSLANAPPIAGLDSRRAHRLHADLLLAQDRFLLVTERGVLADVGSSHGRPFTSVRMPGPARLVIEGEVPKSAGPPGTYRFELSLQDATAWFQALQPFVSPEGRSKGPLPPWARPEAARRARS